MKSVLDYYRERRSEGATATAALRYAKRRAVDDAMSMMYGIDMGPVVDAASDMYPVPETATSVVVAGSEVTLRVFSVENIEDFLGDGLYTAHRTRRYGETEGWGRSGRDDGEYVLSVDYPDALVLHLPHDLTREGWGLRRGAMKDRRGRAEATANWMRAQDQIVREARLWLEGDAVEYQAELQDGDTAYGDTAYGATPEELADDLRALLVRRLSRDN